MAKILIVDDSALIRRLLRRMLEPHGYAIVEVADDAAALQAYTAEQPDIVLLDLHLGETSGLEVLAQLRHLDTDVHVVVITADAEDSTRLAVEQAGARGVLVKPFERQTVVDFVDKVLTAPGAR